MAMNNASYNPIEYGVPMNNSPYMPYGGQLLPCVPGNGAAQGQQPNPMLPAEQMPVMPPVIPEYQPALTENENFPIGQMPENLESPIYTAGFMRQQIGRWIRADLLLGGQLVSRAGKLVEVGASYIVLQTVQNAALIMCDLASIKFAVIIPDQAAGCEYASAYGESVL